MKVKKEGIMHQSTVNQKGIPQDKWGVKESVKREEKEVGGRLYDGK
jgi:hypothetical protein